MAANTITGLMDSIFAGLDSVAKETIGFIPAVQRNPQAIDGGSVADRVAKDQTITFHVVPAMAGEDVTPAAYPADPTGKTIGTDTLSISKSRTVPFGWNGEEQKSLGNKYGSIKGDQFAQAFRTLRNEIESDIAASYVSASRAYGTAGTTPFASDTDALAEVRKILIDNGTPDNDLHLVLNTAAGVKLRNRLGGLTNTVGQSTAQTGRLIDLAGFMIGESAQVKTHTKGTGAGYQVNLGAGYAAGSTSIAVDTGAGTILAGDVLSPDAITDKYVVKTALAAGVLVMQKPGILQTWADNLPLTVGNNYVANMAFHRNAITLLTRLPLRPQEGDMADDVQVIIDPFSGIAYEIAVYKQYRQVRIEVSAAWGVKVTKPEFLATLLG